MDSEYGVGTRKNELALVGGKSANFDYNAPIVIEDTQTERLEGFVRPTGGLSQSGPYELILPAVQDSYLVTQNLLLYVKARVTRENGDLILPGDVVAPVNCLGVAMWEHTEVSINDRILSTSSTTNTHYKGYLETMLSYDVVAQISHLRAQGFALDSPGLYDVMAPAPARNKGFIERMDWTREGNTIDFTAPITADFLRTTNNLAPGNKLTIKLYRAKDSFILNSDDFENNYKLELLDLKMYYHRIRLMDKMAPPGLERYLTMRTELKKFPVAQGMMQYNFKVHYGGKMPKTVVIAQVMTTACEGTYNRNPFYFKHFNVNYLALVVNGRTIPPDALRPDFTAPSPLVAREYTEVFKNTGTFRTNRGNCITLQHFRDGCTVFPFDLTPDMCNGAHLHVAKSGDIGVEIGWKTALPNPITILVHLSYDEVYIHKKGENNYEVETL